MRLVADVTFAQEGLTLPKGKAKELAGRLQRLT